MSKITYAAIAMQGLGDPELGEAFEAALAEARRRPVRECPHRIGAQRLDAGSAFERRDPADADRVVSSAHEAPAEIVAEAVRVARVAQPAWRARPWSDRLAVLTRLAELVGERRLELAALVSLETGKTRAEALAEVDEMQAIVEVYGRYLLDADGFETAMESPSADMQTGLTLRPFGVFGVIAPFNFPLAIGLNMAGAALLLGNAVVFKPSAYTPACGEALAQLLEDAGLPTGTLTLVQGGGETGAALTASDVDGVAFTGSATVGLGIVGTLATPPYVRPVIAEMGGKNPAIISGSTPDLAVAARAVARSAYGYSGQKCTDCSRAVVVAEVYDEFVRELAQAAKDLAVGDPMDPEAFAGPLIGELAIERFRQAVREGRRDGRIVVGGETRDLYADLTVVADLPRGHRLTRDEHFAPLVTVTRVENFDEALAEANAVPFGLSAGVFSDDATEQARFLDEIEAGIVFVNNASGATTGVWPGNQTMSGWKASGTSGRGGFGPDYLQQFGREQCRTTPVPPAAP